jgi:hypothetical protein
MQLLSLLCIRVPQYAAIFSTAAMDMPKSMFSTLISQYWSTESASVGGKAAAAVPGGISEGEEQFTLAWANKLELGYAICAMLSHMHSLDGEAPPW